MSDLQIISGIAFLFSGYMTLGHLSGYHWRIIGRLAWFSTITHLAALTCLRTYLYRNPLKRFIRLFLMGCLAILLLAATTHIGYPIRVQEVDGHQHDTYQTALCYFWGSNVSSPEVFLSSLLLMYNIAVRVIKLHKSASASIFGRFRTILAVIAQRLSRMLLVGGSGTSPTWNLSWHMAVLQPFVALLVVADIYFFVYSSVVSEVGLS